MFDDIAFSMPCPSKMSCDGVTVLLAACHTRTVIRRSKECSRSSALAGGGGQWLLAAKMVDISVKTISTYSR